MISQVNMYMHVTISFQNICDFAAAVGWISFDSTLKSWTIDGFWCLTPLSTIFQLYRGGQLYWRRKRSTRRKPLIFRKSLDKLYHIILYQVHFAMTGVRTNNFSGDRTLISQVHVAINPTTTRSWSLRPLTYRNVLNIFLISLISLLNYQKNSVYPMKAGDLWSNDWYIWSLSENV